jgi:hypothetical protein
MTRFERTVSFGNLGILCSRMLAKSILSCLPDLAFSLHVWRICSVISLPMTACTKTKILADLALTADSVAWLLTCRPSDWLFQCWQTTSRLELPRCT